MKATAHHSLHREGEILLGGPQASQKLAHRSPTFERLVQRHGPARVPAPLSLFATITEAICHQQLSMSAGRAIFSRIQTAYPEGFTPRRVTQAPRSRLTDAGLSNPKASYVTRIATQLVDEPLAPRLDGLDDEATFEELTALPGVGAWTARIVMIFALHRPDVLPCTDHGLLDGARRLFEEEAKATPESLAKWGQAWAPHRSLAAWYIWAERDRLLKEAGKR